MASAKHSCLDPDARDLLWSLRGDGWPGPICGVTSFSSNTSRASPHPSRAEELWGARAGCQELGVSGEQGPWWQGAWGTPASRVSLWSCWEPTPTATLGTFMG